MQLHAYRAVHIIVALFVCVTAKNNFAADVSDGEKIFALKVRPILRAKCFGCHSDDADELKGEFSLQSRDAMLVGGDVLR